MRCPTDRLEAEQGETVWHTDVPTQVSKIKAHGPVNPKPQLITIGRRNPQYAMNSCPNYLGLEHV